MRAIGASNFTAERLAASLEASAKHGLPRYETLQPEYNLMVRDFEQELAPLCARHEVAVIPYYGLASGFLTGKYRSKADLKQSPRGEDVEAYLNQRGFAVLDALDAIAERHRATPAQVALAWLMTKVTRADRQRDQPEAARRPRRLGAAEARSVGYRAAGDRERLAGVSTAQLVGRGVVGTFVTCSSSRAPAVR